MNAAVLDRRLHAVRPDLAAADLRGRVEASRLVDGVRRRVMVSIAPVRREPRPDARLETEALAGEAATVFDERDGFAWAQLERDGYVGYLASAALGPDGPPPTHRVTALRSFVFPGPDLKLPPLATLPLGAAVTPRDEERGYVRLAEGGWLWAGHLAPIHYREPDWPGTAERLLGTPYLWGGRTPGGIDCSGLVQLALAEAGTEAPRDSDLQEAALGRPVPAEAERRRGDLVFWRGHVGVMLDAVRLLHANGHHMAVAIEPVREAERRIRAGTGGGVTSVRRL